MEKKKKDYLIKTLGMQTLICLILFGILFGLKASNNPLFDEVKNMFSQKLEEQFTVEEIQDVFVYSEEESTEANNKEKQTEKSQEDTSEYIPFEEPSLNAEIVAEGGVDISISSKDEVPENISTSSYVINKKAIIPVNGKVTSEFGARIHPITKELSYHSGVDIAADSGTPIYAAFDGKVITAAYDQWNGNYLKLQHENGILTVYCHCEKLNVEEGQIIRAGEIIGYVGSTGSSTGPHLHFELRINDISYDPQIALSEAINAF